MNLSALIKSRLLSALCLVLATTGWLRAVDPQLEASGQVLNSGSTVNLGAAITEFQERVIYLRNKDNAADLWITALTLTGNDAASFAVTPLPVGSGILVPAGDVTALRLRFSPGALAVGEYSAALAIASKSGATAEAAQSNGSQQLLLSASVQSLVASPNLTLSTAGNPAHPLTSVLSEVELDNANDALINLANPGSGSAALGSLSLSLLGAQAADFALSRTEINALAADSTESISISFRPLASSRGLRRAVLRVANDQDQTLFLLRLKALARAALPSLNLSQQQARVWGASESRQTLLPPPQAGSVPLALAASGNYTLALDSNGSIQQAYQPELVASPFNAPTGQGYRALAAGLNHALAINANKRVEVWLNGANPLNDLPAALSTVEVAAVAAGGDFSLALLADGSLRQWGSPLYGLDQVPQAMAPKRFVAVAAGLYHALALRSDGRVIAWGLDYDSNDLSTYRGQANPPATALSGVVAIAAGAQHSLAIKEDGSLLAWGDNSDGQCTIPLAASGRRARAIAAGSRHSVALFDDGVAIAWGDNSSAQASLPSLLGGGQSIAAGDGHSALIQRVELGDLPALHPPLNPYPLGLQSAAPPSSAVYEFRNDGNTALSGLQFSVTGANAADFTVLPPVATLPQNLEPGGTLRFSVRFLPTSNLNTAGLRRAHLNLTCSSHPSLNRSAALWAVAFMADGEASALSLEDDKGNVLTSGSTLSLERLGTLGLPSGRIITLRNLGPTPISGLSVTLTGNDAAEYAFSDPLSASQLPASLSAGESAMLLSVLRPNPSSLTARAATIQLQSTTPSQTRSINLLATPASDLTVRDNNTELTNGSSTLQFGALNRLNDLSSLERSLLLRNEGNLDISSLQFVIVGTDANDFQLPATMPTSLAAGAGLALSLKFQPSAQRLAGLSLRSASLEVRGSSGTGSVQTLFTLPLQASLIYPEIRVLRDLAELQSGDPLNLGDVGPGQLGNLITLTVRNAGSTTLSSLALALGGANRSDFSLVSNLATTSLEANSSATFSLRFTPPSGAAQGARSATLTLSSNDADESQFVINLSARVVQPRLQMEWTADSNPLPSGSTLTLGEASVSPVSTRTVSLRLRNTGLASLGPITASLVGTRAVDYRLVGMPQSVLGEEAAEFTVEFSPKLGPAGARNVMLQIRSNDPLLPIWSCNLLATALTPEAVLLTGGSVLTDDLSTAQFGSRDPSNPAPLSKTFTLRNNGNQTLGISSLRIEGAAAQDFEIATTPPSSLAPGQSSNFDIHFLPLNIETLGLRSAKLVMLCDDPDNSTYSINLAATQLAPAGQVVLEDHRGVTVQAGSDVISLGAFAVGRGTPAAARSFTLRNVGNVALKGLSFALSGSRAADFRISPMVPTPPSSGLATGASVRFSVEFLPLTTTTSTLDVGLVIQASNASLSKTPYTLRGEPIHRITSVVVLGDALSDIGNSATQDLPGFIGGRGRFSNGPLWVDHLAVPSRPWASGTGNNLARAQARLVAGEGSPTLSAQVDALSSQSLIGKHLLVWIGFHDLQDILQDSSLLADQTALGLAISERMTLLAAQLDRIQGAAGLWLVNQLPAALIPFVANAEAEPRELMLNAHRLWNNALATLCASSAGRLRLIDAEAMVAHALAKPTDFGLTKTPLTLFCDNWHPNTLLHTVIARQICMFSVANPEITTASGSTNLLDGKALLNFANQPFEPQTAQTLSLRITNTGLTPLNGLAAVFEGDAGIAASSASNAAALPHCLEPGQSHQLSLEFFPNDPTKAATASSGGVMQSVLRIYSTDRDEPAFQVTLRGIHQPADRVLAEGDSLSLGPVQVSTLGLPAPALSWRLNNQVLAGETFSSLYRAKVSLADGGSYSASVREASARTSSVGPIEVVVAQNNFSSPRKLFIQEGSSALHVLQAQFSASRNTASRLQFQWYKAAAQSFDPTAPQGQAIIGANASQLSLGSTLEATGVYYCEISLPSGGSALGSCHEVQTVASRPVVESMGSLAAPWLEGRIGQWMEATLPSDGMASSFSASGLPSGVLLNRNTGVISGFPNALRTDRTGAVIAYEVSFTASNLWGASNTAKVFIRINPLPNPPQSEFAIAGNYLGFLPRHPLLNENLGGRIEITVTTRGQISGRVTQGRQPMRSFAGGFARHITDWSGQSLVLPATSTAPALQIALRLNANGAAAELLLPTEGAAPFIATNLWRQSTPANHRVGRYAMLMESRLPNEPQSIPAGSGFATLNLAASGVYQFSGRSPDGETLTHSGFLGAGGQWGLFQLLYSTAQKGSLLSAEGVRIEDALAPLDPASNHHKITGSLSLSRPANPASAQTARVYRAGFEATNYDLVGGFMPTFGSDQSALGPLPQPSARKAMNLMISSSLLASSALEGYGIEVGPSSRIAAITRNAATLSAATNNAALSIAITHSTGAITGSFTLDNSGLRRSVTLQGQAIRFRPEGASADLWRAGGYLLLEQLPQPGQLPAAQPRLSLPWSLIELR